MLRFAIRLLDMEGSLEKGLDRQFFCLTILQNSLLAQSTLIMLFVSFPFSCNKLIGGLVMSYIMAMCSIYGMFKVTNELKMMQPVSIITCFFFPVVVLTAIFMMKNE